MSRSNTEEIIAMLWTIAAILLWAHHAPWYIFWLVAFKAFCDHIASLFFAYSEHLTSIKK